ncbi:hypothetical protein FJV80_04325 [Mesorhizobium sp. WSM4310]|uniref:hypothetical protein n=1 Tax=Mesorhizobium sp. WSM4310 TaxID=2589883 RepID=UPI00115E4C52|nr:hypothetical protein [Mesorhizobium sp. WSM4310]TRC91154.1 hypothetical protein FJV80_04325 [Mesorhizobium sp. WSM4310]
MGSLKLSRAGVPVRHLDKLTEAAREVHAATRTIDDIMSPEGAKRLLTVHAELLTAIAREEKRRLLRRDEGGR